MNKSDEVERLEKSILRLVDFAFLTPEDNLGVFVFHLAK